MQSVVNLLHSPIVLRKNLLAWNDYLVTGTSKMCEWFGLVKEFRRVSLVNTLNWYKMFEHLPSWYWLSSEILAIFCLWESGCRDLNIYAQWALACYFSFYPNQKKIFMMSQTKYDISIISTIFRADFDLIELVNVSRIEEFSCSKGRINPISNVFGNVWNNWVPLYILANFETQMSLRHGAFFRVFSSILTDGKCWWKEGV